MKDYKNVTVVGGAGHVGLPLSIYIATAATTDYKVNIWDMNELLCQDLEAGRYPYKENDNGLTAKILKNVVKDKKVVFNDPKKFREAQIIIITIGTPISDETEVPSIQPILDVIDEILFHIDIRKYIPQIILRSTLYPGATKVIKKYIRDKFNPNTDPEGYLAAAKLAEYLVFAPERIAQNTGLKEFSDLPQIIGADSNGAALAAQRFFSSLGTKAIHFLNPTEAEFAKIATNMYRYVQFGLANEFYKLASDFVDVDIHKVIEAANKDYPRMNMALPGPNVGGPCLWKDGRFLTTSDNGGSIVNASHWTNQTMPNFIVKLIIDNVSPENVVYNQPLTVKILGRAFKADSDDVRNTSTDRLIKLCENQGWKVSVYDPLTGNSTGSSMNADVIVVMTPHSMFNDYSIWDGFNRGTLVVDIWKHLKPSQRYKTGIYHYKETPYDY